MQKLLAVGLILAGIGVFFYPHLSDLYWNYRMEEDLRHFSEERQVSQQEFRQVTPDGDMRENSGSDPEENCEEEDEPKKEENSPGLTPMAVLEISSIDLEVPVYRGTSGYKLDQGAGLLEEGAVPGEKGTAAVTAHRAHNYGRLFNRLDEVKEGDRLLLKTREEELAYRVADQEIYDAGETGYLTCEDKEERLVLITCHPLQHPDPPYRLVVEAVRE